jgi:hypothetical protein
VLGEADYREESGPEAIEVGPFAADTAQLDEHGFATSPSTLHHEAEREQERHDHIRAHTSRWDED